MTLQVSTYLIVAIVIVPAILVFLTMKLKIRELEIEKKKLDTEALQNNNTLLELEKEFVAIRNKLTEKEKGVVQFNTTVKNTKEKAL